jgi:CRISPR/Cas system CSM-associated protein Csm3 (group 7 of RAMP superfamily)
MDINYKIEFFSYWHCGSGLAAGADVDALVVKDRYDLPFIPGKTIKGLVKEAMEDLYTFQDKDKNSIIVIFGNSEERNNLSEKTEHSDPMRKGEAFFGNATLHENQQDIIKASQTSKYLYQSISQTTINDSGITVKHSLRKMQVVVPCELYGTIYNVPTDMKSQIETSLKMIKRLGQNRNRGLGRCQFSIIEKGGKA